MPDTEIAFKLTKDNLSKLMKGVVTLNLPDIEVIGNGSTIQLVANDRKNKKRLISLVLISVQLIRTSKRTSKQKTLK